MSAQPYYADEWVTLYHADARDVLPDVGMCDAMITDPPYSVSKKGSTHNCGKGRGVRRFDFFAGDDDWSGTTKMVVDVLRASGDAMTPTASAYVWCGHRQIGEIVKHFEAKRMSTRIIVWAKKYPVPPPPGAGWPSGAEICVYAYPQGRTWTRRADPPKTNVITCDSYRHGQPGKVAHPAQKPFATIRPLIEASTRVGDIILDPFAGSGTTLVAAKQMGRRAIGIEIEKRYCDIIVDRLRQTVLRGVET